MPRDLPIGNGSFLVAFDQNYQIRDLYWPHVGQENHAQGHAFRMGVCVDGKFLWLEDTGWKRDLKYRPGTMITDVLLHHPAFNVEIHVNDAVDFHENLLIRRFDVSNLDINDHEIKLFFHQDFHINGNDVGDTAYYEPDRRAIFHYKEACWFLINGALFVDGNDIQTEKETIPNIYPGLDVGLHQWACGLKEIRNLQGTWRDAEDGQLSGNSIAHGSVDSTVGFVFQIPAQQQQTLYYWMAVGEKFEDVTNLNRQVRKRGPQSYIDRTAAFWKLWLDTHLPDLHTLPRSVGQLYENSLLIIRTQIDNTGAIIAANDSDISSEVRDTYSYMWPRDGALVANALTQAGYLDLPRAFFQFCQRVLTKEGYLLHKYNPDGTLASSWHPWYLDGRKSIPLQEDETALVVWALWNHFKRFGDVSFIKPFYRNLICRMGDFLVDYRYPETGLPLPSYDLWEERHGVLIWTVAAGWGGLEAVAKFAEAFGDINRAERYWQAADEMKFALENLMWLPDKNHFARMINLNNNGSWEIDDSIDASLVSLWKFGMYSPNDKKIIACMNAIESTLIVKTQIGGIARYLGDSYFQISQFDHSVPANPWFICTLWLAEWYAKIAKTQRDLVKARMILEWVVKHALPSGVLAEQINPYTGAPLSVSPLTWSHAEYVVAVHAYLEARQGLKEG